MTMGIRLKVGSSAGQLTVKPGPVFLVPGHSKDQYLTRQKTLVESGLWGVVHGGRGDRPRSLTYMTRALTEDLMLEGVRPKSDTKVKGEKEAEKPRVPILGPTRQQTELYMKKMARRKTDDFRQQIAHLDGPTKHLTSGGKLVPGDIAVFEDKAANAVLLEAESQIKSGYPTIATSSLVAPRRKRSTVLDDADGPTDMKFFSELVKPVKYRWKFEKDKLKTLAPSKHGFHQRSHSPTFQRLVTANEKLQNLIEQETDDGLSASKVDFFETQSQVTPACALRPLVRNIKSEPNTSRSLNSSNSLPATKEQYSVCRLDIRPDIRTIEPVKKEMEYIYYEEDEDEDDDDDDFTCTRTPTPRVETPPALPAPALAPPQQKHTNKKLPHEFKVNLKKTESHTELHLFLPQIQDSVSRGATPETPTRKTVVKLPRISDSPSVRKSPEEDKSKLKKRVKAFDSTVKRKKKAPSRLKADQEEKEIRDRLNDVPTLISLEKEKDYHPASMCMFENCPLHHHRKSNKIRQA